MIVLSNSNRKQFMVKNIFVACETIKIYFSSHAGYPSSVNCVGTSHDTFLKHCSSRCDLDLRTQPSPLNYYHY